MIYLSFVGTDYTPKNKLEKAIQLMVKENDRIAIHPVFVERFKISILEKISALNKIYPRCKEVSATWGESYDKNSNDIVLRGTHFIQFRLYASKETN